MCIRDSFSPYSVELEYGVPFNYIDITEKYDELVANPNIRKTKIKARDLETEISKLQQESGYPYVVNIDTANRANPVDGKDVYKRQGNHGHEEHLE